MVPQILHKVIHGHPDPEPWQKVLLTFQPAILHGYRRHRVRGADYPGIIPISRTASGPESTSQTQTRSSSVLGMLVSGLTDGDIYRLDQFEGDEYELRPVKTRLLRESTKADGPGAQGNDSDDHLRDVLNAAGSEVADEVGEDVDTVAYVYTAGEEQLEDAEWDFGSFKRDKMAWWIEKGS